MLAPSVLFRRPDKLQAKEEGQGGERGRVGVGEWGGEGRGRKQKEEGKRGKERAFVKAETGHPRTGRGREGE